MHEQAPSFNRQCFLLPAVFLSVPRLKTAGSLLTFD